MSGGTFDSFEYNIDEFMRKCREERYINEQKIPDYAKLQKLFGDLKILVHELDWWLAADTGPKDYEKAWVKFKRKWLK